MAISKVLTMSGRFSCLPDTQIDAALSAWRNLMVYVSRKVYIGFVTRKASVIKTSVTPYKRKSFSFGLFRDVSRDLN